ncbi:NAD(P)-dependent oxidoreductase [Candidatus Magnetomoraceae bacterium gMMP-1]
MRIFVTGGTGFIGRSLVPLLTKRGHDVLVLTRSRQQSECESGRLTYTSGDLRDLAKLVSVVKEFKPEAIVHMAWEGLPDYSLNMSRQNLEYGIDVFSLAVKVGCSCILSTGSCWEYFARKGKIAEDDKLEAAKIFPAVKNALRFIGEAIASENGLRLYWLRLFYVYGPWQRRTSLIPHIVESVKEGRPPQIQSPRNRNDFVFVEDIARAIADVLEHQPKNSVYNVGSGYSTAVEDIIRITYKVMNKTFDESIFTKKQPDDTIQNFWADISRIQNDIEWHPEYDIERGIIEIIKKLDNTSEVYGTSEV